MRQRVPFPRGPSHGHTHHIVAAGRDVWNAPLLRDPERSGGGATLRVLRISDVASVSGGGEHAGGSVAAWVGRCSHICGCLLALFRDMDRLLEEGFCLSGIGFFGRVGAISDSGDGCSVIFGNFLLPVDESA